MVARVAMIVVAGTLVLSAVPALADIPPPDPRHREVPIPLPAPAPAPAPRPEPPKPAPQKDTSGPIAAVGFFALFALLLLWLARPSRERSA
jgi:hypothetical protein